MSQILCKIAEKNTILNEHKKWNQDKVYSQKKAMLKADGLKLKLKTIKIKKEYRFID